MKLKLILGLILAMVFSTMAVYGATVLTDPAASGTITGTTYMLNSTTTVSGGEGDWNCTYSGTGTLSANTSFTIGTTALNYTNMTWDSTTVEDAADYTISVSCTNTSAVTETDSSANVIVGNTNPTAPTLTVPTDGSETEDGSITFTVAVTGTQTTACTIDFSGGESPGSASSYSMTHSGDTCTRTFDSRSGDEYVWYVTASDGVDTADSSTWIVTEKAAPGRRRTDSTSDSSSSKTNPLVIIGLLIGAYYLFVKKK